MSTEVYGTSLVITQTGTWDFDSKKENLVFSITYLGSVIPYSNKILRLKGKEMWLEYTYGIDKLETHYVSK